MNSRAQKFKTTYIKVEFLWENVKTPANTISHQPFMFPEHCFVTKDTCEASIIRLFAHFWFWKQKIFGFIQILVLEMLAKREYYQLQKEQKLLH